MLSFVAVSESTIKSLLSSWFDPCLIIIDTYFNGEETKKASAGVDVIADIFVIGQLHIDTQIIFRSEDVRITKVLYLLKRGNKARNGGLYFHPKANFSCNVPDTEMGEPDGGLCEKKDIDSLVGYQGNEVAIRMENFTGVYNYSFLVSLEKKLDVLDNFYVYMTPLIDDLHGSNSSLDNMCKVEVASLFNLYPRMSSLNKLLSIVVFLMLIVSLTALIKGGNNEEKKK